MPHFVTSEYEKRYWIIDKSPAGTYCKDDSVETMFYGSDRLIDGRWLKRGGFKAEGFPIYVFEDQKAGTQTHIVLMAKSQNFRFAAWIYDAIQAGDYKTVSLGNHPPAVVSENNNVVKLASSEIVQRELI